MVQEGEKKLFRTPLSTHKKGSKSHPLLKKESKYFLPQPDRSPQPR